MNRPRTKEDFDKWYLNNNGDPWDYQLEHIRNRLTKSLQFINKFVPASFDGSIIDLGAFNGDFSLLLCGTFKNASIYINDISEIALQQAREKTKQFKNVHYLLNDLLTIDKKSFSTPDNAIILMLECLYYLKESEYKIAVDNLKYNFPYGKIFVSVPITGGKYFTEASLNSIFNESGYMYKSHLVFNLRKYTKIEYFMIPLLNKIKFLRNKLANQAIYLFEPKGA